MRLPFKKAIQLLISLNLLVFGFGQSQKRLTSHGKAKELKPHSKSFDWPRFNGPFDNATTMESPLILESEKPNIRKIWELKKGEGYSSPAINQDRLILFHLDNGYEIIEARNPVTGEGIWSYQYPVIYRDRYGYSNGPRASPVIWGDKVYAHGVTAWLHCLDLKTGKLVWKRNLKKEFHIPDYFFGKGSNPIVYGQNIILNLGGQKGDCVGAFDLNSGKTRWITKDKWGASYSSPITANINGKEVCLVFTGGESRPPTGGLLIIDPENGKKLSRFPWRSDSYESANASPPVFVPPNRVFISECYEKGGVMLELDKNFSANVLWHKPNLNIHWMTPIHSKGFLYGISGRHQQGAELFCVEVGSGNVQWRDRVSWRSNFQNREINLELFRGSILKINNSYLGLSELGSLILINLDHTGLELVWQKQLFFAPGTWTLPALSKGLLYIMQNETDRSNGKKPRLICYDLRDE